MSGIFRLLTDNIAVFAIAVSSGKNAGGLQSEPVVGWRIFISG
jgi:hypothetical protein